MKKLLLALACVCGIAQAQPAVMFVPSVVTATRFLLDWSDRDKLEDTDPVIVQASGTGNTCEQALTNAKRHALEKVNGTWVRSIQRSKDGSYDEEIVQYSGGVVKSYKFLRDDCTYVVIEAEVMKRSNKVQLETADITRSQVVHIQGIKDSVDSKQKAINSINSRVNAVYFKPINTEMRVNEETGNIQVSITGKFAYNDKWKADYLELREMYGFFNLTDFARDATVKISGLDTMRDVVYTSQFTTEKDWKMWVIKSYGVNRVMEIKPHATEEATITFSIPMNKLEQVKSFKVEVL